jgi:ribonuclease D
MSFALKKDLHTITIVEKQANLAACIAAIASENTIAIDLEFDHNLFRYGFQLCLIQIATRKECFIIDPISVKNLETLWACLRNPKQLKILHAAGEDIRLLKTLNCAIFPIFDTEIAAKLLNYPKVSLQNMLLETLGIEVEKTMQKSDWGRRPLSSQQILYAANDVIYLHRIYEKLKTDLEKREITWIFDQECIALAAKEIENEQKKFQDTYSSCSDYERFVLRKIFELREETAKKLNKPPFQVFSNDMLWNLLKESETIVENWHQQKGLHPKIKTDNFLEKLRQTIANAQQQASEDNLSTQAKTANRISAAQRQKMEIEKETIFIPIRKVLVEKYGEQAISLIMSKKVIDMLLEKTSTLSQLKAYQKQLIMETAASLSIDLTNYDVIAK